MPVVSPVSCHFRTMVPGDLAAVVALERSCQDHPWSERAFEDELGQEHSTIALLYDAECLVGYICWWRVCDELHILNLAVAPAQRRRGLGRLLLEHVLRQGRVCDCRRVLLEVRVGNTGAIALYRSFAFREIGRRRAYYADGEDALVMERSVT